MICCILLLLTLTSCVCGTFVVNVTQSSYQAEENHNITLEWSFTTKPHTPSDFLYILCEMFTDDLKVSKVLYHLHEGVEVPESQNKQFSGRVQCDKDVLREGRIRLHVSRLRTEDSGLYCCEVNANYFANFGKCQLNVSAVDQPETQRPTERPEPESRGRIVFYTGLGLTAAAAAALLVKLCSASSHCATKTPDKTVNLYSRTVKLRLSESKVALSLLPFTPLVLKAPFPCTSMLTSDLSCLSLSSCKQREVTIT
ncbi:programmed cell death 1 ligand 1-like isoform X2 [Seriola dumerili]|uniref:programmed cell death 1 ligand 1-like isoform X2 n=1 Tax=Seriola dumerili TaxID=41447 RepID=UPI000BBE1226|nr:programmed cell death 1 ligand 1-like isoform X2 [Seriola dumerili]